MKRIGCALLMATLFVSSAASGDSAESSSAPAPLCGIRSLYTALKVEGLTVNYADLLQPIYVSSQAGSTFPELRKAALDHGAFAEVLDGLSASDLMKLKCPMILHVKPEYDSPEYNHFILCVPSSGGGLSLYDPPDPLIHTAGADLAAIWDGTALAVSSHPIRLRWMWGNTVTKMLLFAMIGMSVLGGMRLMDQLISRQNSSLRWFRQTTLILLLSITIAAVYHIFSSAGFVAQRQAVAAIAAARFVEPPGKIELAEARRLYSLGVHFIDARNAWDFDHDHIEGAMNLPPNASRLDRQRAMAGYQKDEPVVVYCQGPSCPYAGLLGKRLAKDGFSQVHVFTGGFEQWTANHAAAPTSKREKLLSVAGESL